MNGERAPAPLLPGATLGVLGGGQLGRYFVLEARRLGYETWVLDPDADAPAMQVAARPLVAAYDDPDALARFGEACDAVTIEFENVPATSLERLAGLTRVAPDAAVVRTAQDRRLEKRRAAALGLSPVPWAAVVTPADVESAVQVTGLPAILKTATLGYDGKGQGVCETLGDVRDAFGTFGGVPAVLERRIALAAELSVVLARGFDGVVEAFPAARNVHVNGVLDTSSVPSGLPETLLARAFGQARALADGLDYVGTLAVEFFVDEADGLWFNEMAPRPHNSGHFTLDATVSSQFEQQLRALCALPLRATTLLSPGDDGEPAGRAPADRPGRLARPVRRPGARAAPLRQARCADGTKDGARELPRPRRGGGRTPGGGRPASVRGGTRIGLSVARRRGRPSGTGVAWSGNAAAARRVSTDAARAALPRQRSQSPQGPG